MKHNISFFAKLFITLLIIVGVIIWAFYLKKEPEKFVRVNDKLIKIELADTDAKRYQGLSNRKNLCQDCGMLFIFPQKSEENFVMRNMNFPLDIIWIRDNEIIKIDANLPPEGAQPEELYSSPGKVDAVLEVNANYAKDNNLKINDSLQINY